MSFQKGDRIRISKKYHWAQGATGIIGDPPDFAKQLTQRDAPWQGCHHLIQGIKSLIDFYWVWFDKPLFDADGDGPYHGGEIPVDVIERLDDI